MLAGLVRGSDLQRRHPGESNLTAECPSCRPRGLRLTFSDATGLRWSSSDGQSPDDLTPSVRLHVAAG